MKSVFTDLASMLSQDFAFVDFWMQARLFLAKNQPLSSSPKDHLY